MSKADRWLLIISQYYYSHHCFIVRLEPEIGDDLLHSKLIAMAEALLKKKRSASWGNQGPYLGDLDDKYWQGFLPDKRYNLNDCGDIYIRCEDHLQQVMQAIVDYKIREQKDKVKFRKAATLARIIEHHDYTAIKQIIEQHFTLA